MTDIIDDAHEFWNTTDDPRLKRIAGYVIRNEARTRYDRNTSPFTRLWKSTEAFHQRFDSYPPEADAQMRCVEEEVAEVRAAVRIGNLTAEIADVIVTLMGVAMAKGVTLAALEQAMHNVTVKNNAKTTETHAVNGAGKIARKV